MGFFMQQTESCTCGAALRFENSARLEDRTPCFSCGSTSRTFGLLFQADTVTIKASFLAHKLAGPSGEGFRAVDDDGTSISVDADVQGMIVSAIKAPPRHCE